MTGIVDWAGERARMVIAFILMTILAGGFAYGTLPKEGEPDIEIPIIFISVPFPGISAEDAETLLVKPMESELGDLDGLKKMTATAAENYGGVALEFEFGWDKTEIIADIRDRMSTVEARFPSGADKYSVNEVNFSEFPIIIVNLTGDVPERTLLRVAKDLQDRLEGLEPVLEAVITGHRDEMIEVVIDPLRLEAYNVTAPELINVVRNNNKLIAAGEIETQTGAFSVKIPSSFTDQRDIYGLPVKVNGDSVVTLGDLADIRLTFEDKSGVARYNGQTTVALQVVKRKGFNLIDTARLVREEVAKERATWSNDLRAAVDAGISNDQSIVVNSMVRQLEGSVMTAIALVMIVVLASLGTSSALLVGFAIPTSFLLTFAFLALMGITISNIVMFGLILAVGMLVDGAIVVVEYADRKIQDGTGPMHAYVDAAKRMFWPIVSSTATTLCAFLPMLFWPGIPGQFMGMLPVTMIFVLSASLLVALVYLPVMGGVVGRMSRLFSNGSELLKPLPWLVRVVLVPPSLYLLFIAAMQLLNPGYLFAGKSPLNGIAAILPGAILFVVGAILSSITLGAAKIERREKRVSAGHRRRVIGYVIKFIVGNPIMPVVTIVAVIFFVSSVFGYFGEHNRGVEFFVESETEQAIIYVRARGNLSVAEKDKLVAKVEEVILEEDGIESAFAFAGSGGLNQNTGGGGSPRDTIGQIQIELSPWASRRDDPELNGDLIIGRLNKRLAEIPGILTESISLSRGPASGKPVQLRLIGNDWDKLTQAVEITTAKLESITGLTGVENTLPLPGIDWQIDVDVEKAGRFGADVATVGGMVQLVTRGILLDTMRIDSSDEEIEIRVRLPVKDRVLSTLDTLKVRTRDGQVPLSNFITRKPVAKLGQINRINQERYYTVNADVNADGLLTLTTSVETTSGDSNNTASQSPRAIVRELSPDKINGTVKPDLTQTIPASGIAKLFGTEPSIKYFEIIQLLENTTREELQDLINSQANNRFTPINANERRAVIQSWLNDENPLPDGISYTWGGDQVEQEESQAFLAKAFSAALGLMFVILLAQFNSFYNATLVLMAVVLSTTGVLIGMLVMQQPFSIIMTGTGIVALAGIVVNNNIILIDTYQEYSRFMPKIEAIIRTVEVRIRPVLLTTITTMAGLTPMMFGLSLDFINGGYSIDSPTALWWKQLATAVVFGLGIATVLTLVFTPSMLALRVWISTGAYRSLNRFKALSLGRNSKTARDIALQGSANRLKSPEIVWDDEPTIPIPTQAHTKRDTPTEPEVVDSINFLTAGVEALDEPGEQVDLPDMIAPSTALVARAESPASPSRKTIAPTAKTKIKRKAKPRKKRPLKAAE